MHRYSINILLFVLVYRILAMDPSHEVSQNLELEGMFGDKLIGESDPPIERHWQILGCLSAGKCCRQIYHSKLMRTRPDQRSTSRLLPPPFGRHRIVSIDSHIRGPAAKEPSYGRAFPVIADFSCADLARNGEDDRWSMQTHTQGSWWFKCPPGMKMVGEGDDHPILTRQTPPPDMRSVLKTEKAYCIPAGLHDEGIVPPIKFMCFDPDTVAGNLLYGFVRRATDSIPLSTKVERDSNRY